MRSVLARNIFCLLALVCSTLVLSACASDSNLPPPSFATKSQAYGDRAYRLNVGDKLHLTVFGEENLSGTYEVNSLGQVSLPLIGEVPAKGMSIGSFRKRVRNKYANGYLKNPKLTIEVTNYRPVFIHGEVKNGGEYKFKNGLKIRDLIAMAGGYTYRADQSYVVIVRQGYPPARLNLPSTINVLPGDNIKVGERFF